MESPRSDPWVALTHAPNQPVADLIENILDSEGISSYSRRPLAFDVPDFLAAGPRLVLVRATDLERARALLEELDGTDEPAPETR